MNRFQASGADAHSLPVNGDVLEIDRLRSFGGDV